MKSSPKRNSSRRGATVKFCDLPLHSLFSVPEGLFFKKFNGADGKGENAKCAVSYGQFSKKNRVRLSRWEPDARVFRIDCAYCGDPITEGENQSKEHVIPAWLLRDLELTEEVFTSTVVDDKETKPTRYRKLDNLVHHCCLQCNNGWLKKIDDYCRPAIQKIFVHPVAPGERFPEEHLDSLKLFLYKVLLNYLLASEIDAHFSNLSESAKQFFEDRKVPDDTCVFLTHKVVADSYDLNHVDGWHLAPPLGRFVANEKVDPRHPSQHRFKFYLQLGKTGFVLCNTGDPLLKPVYPRTWFHSFKGQPLAFGVRSELDLHADPVPESLKISGIEDSISARLMASIQMTPLGIIPSTILEEMKTSS